MSYKGLANVSHRAAKKLIMNNVFRLGIIVFIRSFEDH